MQLQQAIEKYYIYIVQSIFNQQEKTGIKMLLQYNIHACGCCSFPSDHAINVKIERQTIFVICAQKVAATSALSSAPFDRSP